MGAAASVFAPARCFARLVTPLRRTEMLSVVTAPSRASTCDWCRGALPSSGIIKLLALRPRWRSLTTRCTCARSRVDVRGVDGACVSASYWTCVQRTLKHAGALLMGSMLAMQAAATHCMLLLPGRHYHGTDRYRMGCE